jgi:GNAT superfamily N-acetyltransferase
MRLTVEPLSNYPAAAPTVAEWHFGEWGHTDPGGSIETWAAGLARQAGAEKVPGTLLALRGRTPVGVVCLVEQDMAGYEPAMGLSPWLKGLYVIPAARRRGVGGILVRQCEAWAASSLATRPCTCTPSATRAPRPSTNALTGKPSTLAATTAWP